MRARLRIMAATLMAAAVAMSWAPAASAGHMTPKQVARGFVRAVNSGDVDSIMSFIAPGAVYSGDAACGMAASRCRGLKAIRAIESRDVGNHFHLLASRLVTDGNVVSGNWRGTGDDIRKAGIHRVVGTFKVWTSGDKITKLWAVFDRTDKQTAKLLAGR